MEPFILPVPLHQVPQAACPALPTSEVFDSRPRAHTSRHLRPLSFSPAHTPANLHERLAVLLTAILDQILIHDRLALRQDDNHRTSAILETADTLATADLRALHLQAGHVEDRSHQHGAHGDHCNCAACASALERHDAALVLAEHVHQARLVDGLRIDGVVGAGDVVDARHGPGHGRMPAVVVLRREAGDHDAPAFKGIGEVIVVQETGECKAETLDPVFLREVDGWESGEAAVGGTADHEVVLWLGNGAGGLLDLAREEVVEGCVLCWVRFDHFGHGIAEFEGVYEGLDVID